MLSDVYVFESPVHIVVVGVRCIFLGIAGNSDWAVRIDTFGCVWLIEKELVEMTME